MDPLEPEPKRPVPPAPPRPEWLQPAPAAPRAAGVTPMMDFFQRRVEALERELQLERERAASAQSLLSQQESLKGEVDSQLKALTDQIRREKAERESDESRSHARGRIESLEKRLDEMNATFTTLLKEAVTGRPESPSGGALAAELSAFRGALKDSMDGVARWRGELRELAALVPQVQGLAERLPADEKAFEESVGRRLDEFAARMARSLEDWKRAQEAARAAVDERLETAARERADLARAWESQSRAVREEAFKDRVAREAEVGRQVGELAARLSELAAAQDGSARGHETVREGLDRVIAILTAAPKAKDAVILELETENAELAKVLRDRQDALRRLADDHREVERSLGDSLVKAVSQAEEERSKARAAQARADAGVADLEALKARVGMLERSVAERDERLRLAAAERDELVKSLVAESDKVRKAVEDRRGSDDAAETALIELRRRLDAEAARRAAAEGAAVDSRAQMTALAEQSARAFAERDAVLARFAQWEKERQTLLDALRKKDEMIALLSSTFQGALKKIG